MEEQDGFIWPLIVNVFDKSGLNNVLLTRDSLRGMGSLSSNSDSRRAGSVTFQQQTAVGQGSVSGIRWAGVKVIESPFASCDLFVVCTIIVT